jgi:hypothetical protein
MKLVSTLIPSIRSNWKWLASLLITILFFTFYLTVFRPAYTVTDDFSMISLVSGYLGSPPVPFMVFSNILWGLFLIPFYRLPSNLNWEILIFITINFLSVWSLLHIVLSRTLKASYKTAGVLAILVCDSYFFLNITFTTIASFAALAGFCTILAAASLKYPLKRRAVLFGGVLVLVGSLIRFESFLLVLLLLVPSTLILHRFFNLRVLILAMGGAAILVAACFLFDKIYVLRNPEWNAFYIYDQTRSLIQDTPRATNLDSGNGFLAVGWSRDDFRMFVNWFFPDPQTFSLANLQYLVTHISGREKNLVDALLAYVYAHHIFDNQNGLPYALILVAAWLAWVSDPPLNKALLPLSALILSCLALIIYLVGTQRVPLHVWFSFLSTAAIFSLMILSWTNNFFGQGSPSKPKSALGDSFRIISMVLIVVGAAVVGIQASAMTDEHLAKQAAYRQVLSELSSLQSEGKIGPNALIISPSGGIPVEWSDPMVLDLPKVQYFEMSWLTFSPIYRDVLAVHGIQDLPSGFYKGNNVYLMTKMGLIDGIAKFIEKHNGVLVNSRLKYSVSDHAIPTGIFSDVKLYQLIQLP